MPTGLRSQLKSQLKENEMTTEERLEKLECELARAKRGNRRMFLAGTGLLLGLFALLMASWSMTGVAQGQEEQPDKKVIRANVFILEDQNGKLCAVLAVDKAGPALVLYDQNGKPRVGLTAFKGGPALILRDENGKPRAGLTVPKIGPSLILYDKNGKPIWSAP